MQSDKLRILHLTFEPLSHSSGGGLGVYQTGSSILDGNIADVDYCGPFSSMVNDLNYQRKYFLSKSGKLKELFFSLSHFSTTTYLYKFCSILPTLLENKYDAVILDSTRYGYVVKCFHKFSVPVVVRVHNIERDYLMARWHGEKSFTNWVTYILGSYSECQTFSFAEAFLFLTKEDRNRADNLFGLLGKVAILPICMEKKLLVKTEKNYSKVRILCSGSLWFGPNAQGIIWFLKKVWPQLIKVCRIEVELVIAGRKPSAELMSLASQMHHVQIYSSPSREFMDELFRSSDFYVAPVFSGSGMKVKIAEALSYNLQVVSSEHAAIGYDVAIDSGVVQVCSNSADEWLEKILNKISNLKNDDKSFICFQQNYSLERSSYVFCRFIRDVLSERKIK